MGYELRLTLGQEFTPTPGFDEEYGRIIEQIAMVDLSGIGHLTQISKLVRERQELQAEKISAGGVKYRIHTSVFVDIDGAAEEQYLWEDAYGKPVTAIPIREVYKALLTDMADSIGGRGYTDGYRRYSLAITVIEALIQRFPESEGRPLVALTYGH